MPTTARVKGWSQQDKAAKIICSVIYLCLWVAGFFYAAWTERVKAHFFPRSCWQEEIWKSSRWLEIMGVKRVCRWVQQMIMMLSYQEMGKEMISKDKQKKNHLARIFEIPSSSWLSYFCCHRTNQGLVKKQLPRVAERDARQRRTKKTPQRDTRKAPSEII